MENFDIVMIGNFAVDKLIVDGKEEIASGGGVYYGSVVAHRLGARVAVITRLHPQDFPRLDELRNAGIRVFAQAAPGTSGIANYYRSSDMETRICKPIGFGGQYRLDEIPDVSARVIMVSPLFAGEFNLELLQNLARKAPLAMDIQGFVRVPVGDDLIFQPWSEMEEGLKQITYLKLDKAEAKFLTGEDSLEEAARILHGYGPKELVITQSEGVTVSVNGETYFAPFTPRSLAGRTGRGDTCFSTYITKRLNDSPRIAAQWAAVVTSLKQEVPGPWQGTYDQVANLVKTQFEQ